MMDIGSITILVLLIAAVVVVLAGAKMVPQGNAWTVQRFGKYTRTLSPGLNLIIPFIDTIGNKVVVMEQVLDVPPQEVISADNAMVMTDAVCFYQILDPVKATYEVNDLPRAMQNLMMTNIRAVLGSLELDDMLSNRDKINGLLLRKVDEATDPWGLKVTRIEIRDIAPPADLVESMANQMKAERDKRAAILLAEGKRAAEILEAEGLKQGAILKAEGDLEAAKRQAEARERLAQAEAAATHMLSEAIQTGDNRAINYFIAEKYVDALGQLAAADNAKVIMMPLEASNVIGSVAGITELIKDAQQTVNTEA